MIELQAIFAAKGDEKDPLFYYTCELRRNDSGVLVWRYGNGDVFFNKEKAAQTQLSIFCEPDTDFFNLSSCWETPFKESHL